MGRRGVCERIENDLVLSSNVFIAKTPENENGRQICSDTHPSQADMLSGYQKPLVMTLVTRSICCQISRKGPDRKLKMPLNNPWYP